jgi:hypothetical protein
MPSVMRAFVFALSVSLLFGACSSLPGPEETTPDGLVRVPSRKAGGVYRAPDASFSQYQRLIFEPPSISFVAGWRDTHSEITDSEITRIRTEAARIFREEFARVLIERGPYTFAEDPAPDVLIVSPAIEDLDIAAPGAGATSDKQSFVNRPVKMKITGELRDAASGRLVGRVIMFESEDRYAFGDFRLANRTQTAHEERLAFAKWSRLFQEAMNVAKTKRE